MRVPSSGDDHTAYVIGGMFRDVLLRIDCSAEVDTVALFVLSLDGDALPWRVWPHCGGQRIELTHSPMDDGAELSWLLFVRGKGDLAHVVLEYAMVGKGIRVSSVRESPNPAHVALMEQRARETAKLVLASTPLYPALEGVVASYHRGMDIGKAGELPTAVIKSLKFIEPFSSRWLVAWCVTAFLQDASIRWLDEALAWSAKSPPRIAEYTHHRSLKAMCRHFVPTSDQDGPASGALGPTAVLANSKRAN